MCGAMEAGGGVKSEPKVTRRIVGSDMAWGRKSRSSSSVHVQFELMMRWWGVERGS